MRFNHLHPPFNNVKVRRAVLMAVNIELASRIRDGIRDAGGVPLEFPIHPIQETGKRPTAALDRNLAYLSLCYAMCSPPAVLIFRTGIMF